MTSIGFRSHKLCTRRRDNEPGELLPARNATVNEPLISMIRTVFNRHRSTEIAPLSARRLRRRFVVGLVLLIGLGVAAYLIWPAPDPPSLRLTNLHQLRPGMSEAEVEAVVGPPSTDLTGQGPGATPPVPANGRLLQYDGKRMSAKVSFDKDGRVVQVLPEIRSVSGMDRIRLRTGW